MFSTSEGDKFESSLLRLDRCCFLVNFKAGTHLLWTFQNVLRLPSIGLAFEEEKASYFRAIPSPQVSEYLGQEKGRISEDEIGWICEWESRFLWKNSQAEITPWEVHMGEPSWRDGCFQSLPICLSELPDLLVLRQLSEKSQRCWLSQAFNHMTQLDHRKGRRHLQGS